MLMSLPSHVIGAKEIDEFRRGKSSLLNLMLVIELFDVCDIDFMGPFASYHEMN